MDFCEEEGFLIVSSALRTEIRMRKNDVSIYWKGGWTGEATFLEKEGNREEHVLVQKREKMSSLVSHLIDSLNDPSDPISTLRTD